MFIDDVRRSPETIRATWEERQEHHFPAFLRSSRRVWLIGMGASYSACMSAAPLFWELGIPAAAELASTVAHFALPAVYSEDCFILVSQSGESAETVSCARLLAEHNVVQTIAVTNNVESTLARSTRAVCDLHSSKDDLVSVATHVATFLVLKKMALFIAGLDKPSISPVVAEAERLVAIGEQVTSKFANLAAVPPVIDILGRGPLLGTAYQSGIVLREVPKIPTSAWDAGEYRHGAMEAIRPDQMVILLAASDGPVAPLDAALGRKLRQIPGTTIVIGPQDGDLPVNAPKGFGPILDLIMINYLALHLAAAQDITPGVFRWAAHVTTVEA